MRLKSLIVGVLVSRIFRRANVVARFSAKLTGSPSPSTSSGNASTSSRNTYRHGVDRNPVAELLPVSSSIPPGNSLLNIVLPQSRLRLGAIRSASTGVSVIMLSSRCLLRRFAISTVGCTASSGPGAWWMQ